MRFFIAVATLCVMNGIVHGEAITPKESRVIPVIDGKLSTTEWADATAIELSGGARLLFKRVRENIYIGIDTRQTGPRYGELFIQGNSGTLLNLHASMQLGERMLPRLGWTDDNPPWVWGNNTGWKANVVRRKHDAKQDAPFAAQIEPADGVEFEISRGKIGGCTWRIRVGVRDFEGRAPDVFFPESSDREEPATWAELNPGC